MRNHVVSEPVILVIEAQRAVPDFKVNAARHLKTHGAFRLPHQFRANSKSANIRAGDGIDGGGEVIPRSQANVRIPPRVVARRPLTESAFQFIRNLSLQIRLCRGDFLVHQGAEVGGPLLQRRTVGRNLGHNGLALRGDRSPPRH